MPLPDKYALVRDPILKAPRRAPATSEEWAALDAILEEFDRTVTTYGDNPAGQAARAGSTNAAPPNPLPLAEAFGHVTVLHKIIMAPKDKGRAGVYFGWCARILGPDISIEILRYSFGPEILKKALVKQRGRPTFAQSLDDRRIHVYADAITSVTGESTPLACERLAKMGLRVRTPAGKWKGVTGETVRKRYMKEGRDDLTTIDTLRLLQTWHRAGEPGFLNWLKALIAQDSSGPASPPLSSDQVLD
jgi:hypothetical protein